ncbi:hypothetical protein [Pedobacter antarcticus]|uniref:Glyoxalase n=2 Tax=Pedobacter antarcticus TaxID=34086 RepID=A0A081PET2_9SPHI|nr:hypothetical protein [Pedobacter antarcticus]KEQ29205.1 hypothetical protein N180_17545 [Pedobacter antarcticus 4BY]SDL78466.1 Uncharacterized conserved protein PhnB, glyoxalase superfamily [Pedobacter antarcticus]SFE99876.1 Uncharacterized conserved protein PhnB, glyoxalase superfamily [Pedobacter antarcticus]
MKSYKDKQTIIPYLMLENAAAFVSFAKMVFDAEIIMMELAEDNRTILLAEIKIGLNIILLAEAVDPCGVSKGNFLIYVGEVEDTFNRAIFHGSVIIQDIKLMDFGRSGGLEDPFGNTWWLTTA